MSLQATKSKLLKILILKKIIHFQLKFIIVLDYLHFLILQEKYM